jgi:hypothetical protein
MEGRTEPMQDEIKVRQTLKTVDVKLRDKIHKANPHNVSADVVVDRRSDEPDIYACNKR